MVILSFRLLYKPFVACHACPCLFFLSLHILTTSFFFGQFKQETCFCLCSVFASTGKSSSSHTRKRCVCVLLKNTLYIKKTGSMTGVRVNSENPPQISLPFVVFHFLLLMLWKNENHFWGFLFSYLFHQI